LCTRGIAPSRRELAPEPEYPAEVLADPQALTTKVDVPVTSATSVGTAQAAAPEEVAAIVPVTQEAVVEAVPETVQEPVAAVLPAPRWRAEAAELTAAEASASLEQEMQAAIRADAAEVASHTHNLAEFAEPDIASPVDDEPVLSDVPALVVPVAEPETLAVAAAASSASNAVSNSATSSSATSSEEHAPSEKPFTQSFAAVPSLMPDVGHKTATDAPSVVEMASSAAAKPAPNTDRSAPEDEIDFRTKAQMDAAWSNWHDIRNTVVTPKLADQIEEVAEASAKEEAGTHSASEAGSGGSSEIASIVDTMLAEMRPKLLEEIAKKLAAKKE